MNRNPLPILAALLAALPAVVAAQAAAPSSLAVSSTAIPAQPPGSAAGTVSGVPVEGSTAPPSAVDTGESQTVPAARPMTEPAGEGIFMSLTRTAFPLRLLPNNTQVVRPAEAQKFDAQNAGQAISRETSIETLPIGQTGSLLAARIRGALSVQTLVLLDGRPYSGFALGSSDLSEIPIESIDRVEIVRGGVSALYGPNAVGGVVNIITKRAMHEGLPISHVGYEQGEYGRQAFRLDFGSRMGRFDYFFYANRQRHQGFRQNQDADTHNIGGNAGLSMGRAGKLMVDVASYEAEIGTPGLACGRLDPYCIFPGQPLTAADFDGDQEKIASTPFARQETDSDYIRTSYLLPLPAGSFLALRFFGSERTVDYQDPFSPNAYASASTLRRGQSKGGEAQLDLPAGFTLGGSFLRDRMDNSDRLDPGNNFNEAIEHWGIFVQENLRWKRLTLVPSGRYDHNSQSGESWNPRVQAILDPLEWLRLSGSAARSFRAPTLDDLYVRLGNFYAGNPDLRPERAWTYDAGFKLHNASSSVSAMYFLADVRDLIQIVPVTPTSLTVANVEQAKRQGAEIELAHAFNAAWSTRLNYTYLDNRGRRNDAASYVTLSYSPRHTVNHSLTWQPSRQWTADSVLRYTDERWSQSGENGTKLGSQLIWDLRLAYRLRQAELYFGSSNVTDKRYQEQAGYPMPGRTIYGGVGLRLWG